MARWILIGTQLLATGLFLTLLGERETISWVAWAVPLLLVFLVLINSFWFSRFVSWLIFAIGFFCFLVLLSAFTLRWRLEPGFNAMPFYRAIIMYAAFVYISLGQIKLLGGSQK